jgi:hypothetical protein
MAPKRSLEGVQVPVALLGTAASPARSVKRGRGHPKGSKNKPKIAPPAPAGESTMKKPGHGCSCSGRKQPPDTAIVSEEDVAPPSAAASPPQALHADSSATGPSPLPGLLPPPGFAPKKAPLGSLDYEFFIFVKEETLENLKLPDKFVEVFAGHESGYAFLREASAGQKMWRMAIYHDRIRHMFLTGD